MRFALLLALALGGAQLDDAITVVEDLRPPATARDVTREQGDTRNSAQLVFVLPKDDHPAGLDELIRDVKAGGWVVCETQGPQRVDRRSDESATGTAYWHPDHAFLMILVLDDPDDDFVLVTVPVETGLESPRAALREYGYRCRED